MKIGDEIMVHGFLDEIRQDMVIIRNAGGYFGTAENEVMPASIRTGDRISRCDLFNKLATITAEDANEMKAKIYAVIQEMPALPDKAIAHVHLDTEELLERIREEYELVDEPQGDDITTANEVMPAARRGSWEVRPAPEKDRVLGRWRYYCSACGGWTSYGRSDFCPRCGARMKGADDE